MGATGTPQMLPEHLTCHGCYWNTSHATRTLNMTWVLLEHLTCLTWHGCYWNTSRVTRTLNMTWVLLEYLTCYQTLWVPLEHLTCYQNTSMTWVLLEHQIHIFPSHRFIRLCLHSWWGQRLGFSGQPSPASRSFSVKARRSDAHHSTIREIQRRKQKRSIAPSHRSTRMRHSGVVTCCVENE